MPEETAVAGETQPKPKLKVCDSNEPGEIRMKLLETGWEQRKLLIGDYWFFTHDYKKVGIERKEINDFLASMGDRLTRQLETLLEHYDLRILLIEGSWKTVTPAMSIVSSRGIEYQTWTMVWNYIRRFQDKGITLELTVNEGHTIQRLNELYALYQKPYSLSGASKDFTDDRVLAFPSGCRGKTAMDCLEYFGSLARVVAQYPGDLIQVKGIGEKKAKLIYNHFHKGEAQQPSSEDTQSKLL
jgi:ERCC4-type nuclease